MRTFKLNIPPGTVPRDPPPGAEFGIVAARGIKRCTRQGTLRPLICTAEDGATYVVKPLTSSGCWAHCLEWICARLGRALHLNIPNYRQIELSPELTDAWNLGGGRFIETGVGFGSQFVSGADECDAVSVGKVADHEATRILAFDWWIRNNDRRRHNPNLLWSHEEDRAYLIDHEKAGHTESSEAFWQDHLFAKQAPWMTAGIRTEMQAVLGLVPAIRKELPSAWTKTTGGLDWFFKHLHESIAHEPQQHWRSHE
jgi:hypothetical protein